VREPKPAPAGPERPYKGLSAQHEKVLFPAK
jgi:hypothetical protein